MKKITLTLCSVSLVALTACTDPAYVTSGDGNTTNKAASGAIIGGILGAGLSAATKNDPLIGAAVGAGAGALIGNSLAKQEAELRKQLDSDVRIENTGDRLILTMPQDILFDVDSATVSASLEDDLYKVASSLNDYPDTTVQVLGHTDNTGTAAHNQGLSQRRANAVADVLMTGGVPFGRIESIGRGEDQPIASNLDEAGRHQNRRVEIVILPNAA
ncbi:outer membrane protein OmpA-like peptidoglycan-associated protein [Shimia isoporae]|uniref:Outer membrane protein OmpA-like peptidoglycan-associated protein n=1 Tax=Shimia isoporae TaxID=647720 RepID=A0A4R1N1N5_9RHOB|nr:OmpA family protein [Shimia isoporae]TCK99967.1 outer membrane protein OmpA-like peptidoglycan-associated protein [Shimia isoporae]